jgi:hypothetical protein
VHYHHSRRRAVFLRREKFWLERNGQTMAIYGESPHSESNIPQLVGIHTNIAGYFFDAVFKTDHTDKLQITEHPVETGASVTDHSFKEPRALSMEIGMSDVCSSFINGQFAQKSSRSVSAYEILKQLQANRVPLRVYTRLSVYDNMLIETITSPDDYKTISGLRATVGFREVIVAVTNTVILPNRTSANPQKTGSTNQGTVQPVQQVPQSLLRAMAGG